MKTEELAMGERTFKAEKEFLPLTASLLENMITRERSVAFC